MSNKDPRMKRIRELQDVKADWSVGDVEVLCVLPCCSASW